MIEHLIRRMRRHCSALSRSNRVRGLGGSGSHDWILRKEMENWEKWEKIGEYSHLWSRSSDTKLEFEKAKLCSLHRRNKSEREFIYCSRNSITRSKDSCRDSCHNRKQVNYHVGSVTTSSIFGLSSWIWTQFIPTLPTVLFTLRRRSQREILTRKWPQNLSNLIRNYWT